MSAHQSAWNNWAPTRAHFLQILYSEYFFRKYAEKIQSHIKMTRIMSTLHDLCTFNDNISLHSGQNEKCFIRYVEKANAHILKSTPPPRKSCRLWDNAKNIVQPARPQMTKWRTRFAFWITTATNTHSEYVTLLIPFRRQHWLRYVIRTLPVL